MEIVITSGSEGPRHDPYYYEEEVISHEGNTVTIHNGLAQWFTLNDSGMVEVYEPGSFIDLLDEVLVKGFGYTHKQLTRMHRKANRPFCKICGVYPRDVTCADGYPGETLLMCAKCGTIVASDINMSVIM